MPPNITTAATSSIVTAVGNTSPGNGGFVTAVGNTSPGNGGFVTAVGNTSPGSINATVERDYLTTIFEQLPSEWLDNAAGFKAWLQHNANTVVNLNDNDSYHVEVSYYNDNRAKPEKLLAYHLIDGVKSGTEHKVGWYENGNRKYHYQSKDGQQHGSHRQWFAIGRLDCNLHFQNGVQEGVQEWYYPIGKLQHRQEVSNGVTLTDKYF